MRILTAGKLFLAMALTTSLAAGAQSVVIDFEELAQSGNQATVVASGYESDGYVFTSNIDPLFASDAFGAWTIEDDNFNGSTALFNAYTIGAADGGTTTLRRQDGTTFAFESIDLGQLFADSGSTTDVVIVGTKGDGTVVNASFLLPAVLTPATYALPDTFVDLVAVRWEQLPQFHQFDNLVLVGAPVPEPANLVLLLVGSVTLLWVIRRAA